MNSDPVGMTGVTPSRRAAIVGGTILAAIVLAGFAVWRWYPTIAARPVAPPSPVAPVGPPAQSPAAEAEAGVGPGRGLAGPPQGRPGPVVQPVALGASVLFACPRCRSTCRLPGSVAAPTCPYCGAGLVRQPPAAAALPAVNPGLRAGSTKPAPIVISAGAVRPHPDRGVCSNCHTVVNAGQSPAVGAVSPQQKSPGPAPQVGGAPPIPAGAVPPILIEQFGTEVVTAVAGGARVTGVMGGSRADTAGIKAGDVILRMDKDKVNGADQFKQLALKAIPEANAKLMVLRNGRAREVQVMVGEGEMEGWTPIPSASPATAVALGAASIVPPAIAPGTAVAARTPALAPGATTAVQPAWQNAALPTTQSTVIRAVGAPVAPLLIKQFGMSVVAAPGVGARVTGVMGGSVAQTAGLLPNDVILELNQAKVKSADHLGQLALQAPPETNAQLMVLRNGRTLDFKLLVGQGEMDGWTPIKVAAAQGTGTIALPSLGVELTLSPVSGAKVASVISGSGAQKAGILAGDTIVECNGVNVLDPRQLAQLIGQMAGGAQANLNLVRNGRMRKVPVQLEAVEAGQTAAGVSLATGSKIPSPKEQNAAGKEFIESHWLGLEGIPLTPELATEYLIPAGETGVLVDEVTLEAAESGILAGDMVQAINGVATPDLRAFFVATQKVRDERRATVDVSRRGKKLSFTMEAQNTNVLGFSQMEAAQPIQPGAISPHRARGKVCTSCHVIMETGGQLPTDAGDILPTPPPISRGAVAPHRDRGPCVSCHVIR